MSDIQISIDTDQMFVCQDEQIKIDAIKSEDKQKKIDLIFYIRKNRIPHRCDANIYIVYLNEDDKIQTDQISFRLPFGLLLYPSVPINSSKYVFVLEIKEMQNVPKPTELFRDLIPTEDENVILKTPQVLTMVFYCNKYDVTLLLSRKGGRI